MIHFIPSGGRIGADHLRYLIDFFEREGLEHTVHDGLIGPEEIEEGHAYVSCDLNMDYNLAPVKDQIFQVQLPHNLTGLKGSNLAKSQANLNLLAGRQLAQTLKIDLADPRYDIRGYVKWDVIYPERHRQKERREEIAAELGMDPDLPWVCLYPTGPSDTCRGNQYQSPLIYNHLKNELGEIEFAFCDHANNRSDLEAKRAVQHLKYLASKDPRIHVVDGGDTLRHITACDLFITDIASTVITAVSMNKPVVFITAEHNIRPPERVDNFQCGVFYEQVKDFKEFIRSYKPPRALSRLFERCVQYDDEKNRERIAETIVDNYDKWKKKVGPRTRKRLPAGPVRARRIADIRNITWQKSTVTVEDREELLGQRGCVVWLTGLSASGKSTIADRLASRLMADGHLAHVLDGDNLRHGLNSDLGFSAGDRDENIRRVGEVAALMARSGLIAISAFISPYRAGRDRARATAGENRFIEVFVATPLTECERRDPRGLYKKARSGEIKNFTGIDAPYEKPAEPELILRTRDRQPDDCAEEVFQYLKGAGFLTGARPAALPSVDMNIAVVFHTQEIFSSHLKPLCDYLDAQHIPYERVDPMGLPSFEEGVAIACVPGTFRRFPDRYFTVMVAHNLTGLKGTKFHESKADLNLVPGMRNTVRMAERGRSYELGGYPKWDRIYPMRFKVDEARQNLRDEYDFPADRKIVVFYPTQSLYHRPGLHQAMDFYDRCRKELGATEFFVCLHHNFIRSPKKSYDLDFLRSWESAHESVHVVDGADALPIITACHLFVTDACSTVVTALSMKKPVLFIEMELEGSDAKSAGGYLRQIDVFQSHGVKVDEVDDLDQFIKQGHPGDRTQELFRSCVAYDDDRNCERIMQTIGEQYRLRQETRRRS